MRGCGGISGGDIIGLECKQIPLSELACPRELVCRGGKPVADLTSSSHYYNRTEYAAWNSCLDNAGKRLITRIAGIPHQRTYVPTATRRVWHIFSLINSQNSHLSPLESVRVMYINVTAWLRRCMDITLEGHRAVDPG